MKKSFRPAPAIDIQRITDTIDAAMASAGFLGPSSPAAGVTGAIRQALSSVGPRNWNRTAAVGSVIDVAARVVQPSPSETGGSEYHTKDPRPRSGGTFEAHQFSNLAGARSYKLYVPANVASPPPLIVMLHGCTQSAADFAAGTGLNGFAEEHGFLVLYPEQSSGANVSKCWNWFKAEDQVRGSGEPALIAAMARDVAASHGVDVRRVFVAGLSAGAAMAVILGQTYPELFAGVGAHSGLPYASAHDIPSALATMKGGRGSGLKPSQPRSTAAGVPGRVHAIPTIVFHGDRDHTVQHSNGDRIVDQAVRAYVADAGASPLKSSVVRGQSREGRDYTRTFHADAAGTLLVESWVIHGAGHAWSGGQPTGSYTDAAGPEASAEMVRFFLALPRPGSA